MSCFRITPDLIQKVSGACAALPLVDRDGRETDPVKVCMLAVLDFQMRGAMMERALEYFYSQAAPKLAIKSLADMESYLASDPSDEGAAVALWGARYWTRLAILRNLAAFFLAYQREHGVGDEMEAMRQWAEGAQFKRDFQGKVKGLGYNMFTHMLHRLGANTAAPTGWSCHYLEEALGKTPKDACVVDIINATADAMGVPRAQLDWRIRVHRGHP